MSNDKTLNQRRITAAIIDLAIILAISSIISDILIKVDILNTIFGRDPFIALFYITFSCTKDLVFKNASIGKRMAGLVVVKESGYEPSKKNLVLRNVLQTFLPPMEFYRFFIEKDRLYGDIIANTKVVYKHEQLK